MSRNVFPLLASTLSVEEDQISFLSEEDAGAIFDALRAALIADDAMFSSSMNSLLQYVPGMMRGAARKWLLSVGALK